jgi:hypothetical protein
VMGVRGWGINQVFTAENAEGAEGAGKETPGGAGG